MSRFLGSERLDRKRMDFASHALAKRFVDELVPSERALANKLSRHDARGEVGVIVGYDLDLRLGESGADELCDLFWVHPWILIGKGPRRMRRTSALGANWLVCGSRGAIASLIRRST